MADTAYETSYGDKRRDKRKRAPREGSKREEAMDRMEKRHATIAGGSAPTKGMMERLARGG